MIDKLNEMLKGIDKYQCESSDGWWETTTGAEFGANKLKEVQDLVKKLTLTDVISRLSDRVDEIAKNTDADVNRTLFRIVGNHIEVYEIDLSEEKVKSFLGNFKINDL